MTEHTKRLPDKAYLIWDGNWNWLEDCPKKSQINYFPSSAVSLCTGHRRMGLLQCIINSESACLIFAISYFESVSIYFLYALLWFLWIHESVHSHSSHSHGFVVCIKTVSTKLAVKMAEQWGHLTVIMWLFALLLQSFGSSYFDERNLQININFNGSLILLWYKENDY